MKQLLLLVAGFLVIAAGAGIGHLIGGYSASWVGGMIAFLAYGFVTNLMIGEEK